MKHILLGILGIAACTQHSVTMNTNKTGPTQVFLIDADSSSITLKDGTVLTSRTTPGINWGGYPSRFGFGLFTDPPIQIADSGAMVIIDFDLGRSFYAVDPANAAAGFNYVGYMQVR